MTASSAQSPHRFSLGFTFVLLVSAVIVAMHSPLLGEAAPAVFRQTVESGSVGDIVGLRAHPTATLLSNGKVLLAGGYGDIAAQLGTPLKSAEVYDPATRNWSTTGDLITDRVEFTATLLQDGRVLVAGGGVSGGVNSSELYDPLTGTWSTTGSLITGRSYHAATVLRDGNVLVAGGFDGNGKALASAELYDPGTATWRRTGDLHTATAFHTATLLSNGKVLVAGGNTRGYRNTAELYDPVTGTWSQTGHLNNAYYWHTATRLANGKVLLVGSLWFETNTTTELYDPGTETWTVTGRMIWGRVYHSATLLPNGKVLILGGYDNPSSTFRDAAELYDPATETWMPAPRLNVARAWHTATMLPDGKVLVAGGGNASGGIRRVELYDAVAPDVSLAKVRRRPAERLLPTPTMRSGFAPQPAGRLSCPLRDDRSGAKA